MESNKSARKGTNVVSTSSAERNIKKLGNKANEIKERTAVYVKKKK